MNAEDEIVQLIEGMAGKYSPYVIFADWVKMYAIAIQNACSMQDKAWQARQSMASQRESIHGCIQKI